MKKKWRALKRKRQNDRLMDNDLRTTNKLDDLTNDLSTSLTQDDLPSKHIGHNNNFEIENYSLSSDDLVSFFDLAFIFERHSRIDS
jgi:hypothetical protein